MSNLKRTPTSSGNRLKATWSFWVKRNRLNGTSSSRYLFYASSGSQADAVRYNDDDGGDSLRTLFWNGTINAGFINYDKLRDTSSWQHCLIVYDSTLNTTDNFSNNDQTLERIKIFVNGRRMIETAGNGAQNVGIGTNQLMTLWGNPGIVNALFATDTGSDGALITTFDAYFVDGQALTPDVFGFYKEGKGYISAGSSQATDFRPGQWVPKTPRVIKAQIERNGGFGVNGFYLPMNDSSNFGADFHCEPNSIITLKGEDLPQPRNGAPTTSDAYVSQLRTDPYAANLVLALPFVSSGLCTNGTNVGVNTGFGDYSTSIKGSGTLKVGVITASSNLSIANTAAYYGSAALTGNSSNYISFDDSSDFDIGLSNEPFTWETWFNLTTTSTTTSLGVTRGGGVAGWNGTNGHQYQPFYYSADNKLYFQFWNGASLTSLTSPAGIVTSNQWNHYCVEYAPPNLTMYVNGVAVDINTTATFGKPTSSNITVVGNNSARDSATPGIAYQQDVRLYKGVAKYKGGFDVPKPYTPVGIATWRAVPDTTANNFATLNPLHHGTSIAESDGNLSATWSGSGWQQVTGTVGVSTGKWYWESVQTSAGNQMSGIILTGIGTVTVHMGQTTDESLGYYGGNGYIYYNSTDIAYGSTWGQNDIIGVAFNATDREIEFYKNGASQGIQTGYTIGIRTEGTYAPAYATSNSGNTSFNFGQNPTFSGNTTAGTFTDSNGKGLFKYQPPTDFLALCEDNLPRPVIEDPGEHFKTVLWTGDGNDGRSITGVGFQPDLVWIKNRANGVADSWHSLSNSVTPGRLFSNETTSEDSFKDVGSFDDNGMTINYGSYVNTNGGTYVAWCWKAGGAAVSNTDGTLTSQVSANQTAGFSIVSYDGSGAQGSIGHGLGKTPAMIIVKNRTDGAGAWQTWHQSFGTGSTVNRVYLNSTVGPDFSSTNIFKPNSDNSTILLNTGDIYFNRSPDKYIAYCWAEIEGFSKFGSYVGNGNADGPFVYTGGKPAFVMIKRIDTTGSWGVWNSSVDSTNPSFRYLLPNDSGVEQTANTHALDFLSNGFKIRNDQTFTNASGGTYIFACWMESPFTTANAK